MTRPLDATERFSSRVDAYVKHRPSYPPEVIALLRAECGLSAASVVCDLGSGTGALTKLLLDAGAARVYGVEPNAAMREAAERAATRWSVESILARDVAEGPTRTGSLRPTAAFANERFTSVAARAEATTLPDASVDLVTAGQAFHWFDGVAARAEVRRILRADGSCALVWNDRLTDATPFLAAYEALLNEHATDYREVRHKNLDEATLASFFGGAGRMRTARFANEQRFDFEALRGRLLSSSYAPEPGDPRHEPMMRALRDAFDRHARGGEVAFVYETKVYYGRLSA